MGRAKAGIVESTIPTSWTAGLRKWYFQLKKQGQAVPGGVGNVNPVSSRRRYREDDCRGRCCNVWRAEYVGQ